MLVLTRSKDESVMIGPDVALTVRGFGADDVLLEVLLPSDVALRGPHGPIALEELSSDEAPPATPTSKGSAWLKKEDTLCIGGDVAVKIVALLGRGDVPYRVRLGFRAPKSVAVVRKEISGTSANG